MNKGNRISCIRFVLEKKQNIKGKTKKKRSIKLEIPGCGRTKYHFSLVHKTNIWSNLLLIVYGLHNGSHQKHNHVRSYSSVRICPCCYIYRHSLAVACWPTSLILVLAQSCGSTFEYVVKLGLYTKKTL